MLSKILLNRLNGKNKPLYLSIIVKRELILKMKLSVYRFIYIPTLIYGHKLWVVTERTRSWIQMANMGFPPWGVRALSLKDRVRSSVILEGLRVELLLLPVERNGHLVRITPKHLPGEVFWTCPTRWRSRGRPGHIGLGMLGALTWTSWS